MTQDGKLGAFPYVIGGLSFIPLVGIPFGLAAIIWGLVKSKHGGKKLALIGTGGIVFTVLLYSGLFYFGFVKRGGVYDDLRVKLAKSNLTQLVQAVEFYKVQNGRYPDSLETLKTSLPKDAMVFINDPTDVHMKGAARNFYYQRIDENHYYLLGVGPDGKPCTNDDIVPTVKPGPQGKVGLIIGSPEGKGL